MLVTQDRFLTDSLKDICEKLDVQLLDHFIAGKKNVFSFAKEGFDCVSDNEIYRKSIEEQSNMKFRQQTFVFRKMNDPLKGSFFVL